MVRVAAVSVTAGGGFAPVPADGASAAYSPWPRARCHRGRTPTDLRRAGTEPVVTRAYPNSPSRLGAENAPGSAFGEPSRPPPAALSSRQPQTFSSPSHRCQSPLSWGAAPARTNTRCPPSFSGRGWEKQRRFSSSLYRGGGAA